MKPITEMRNIFDAETAGEPAGQRHDRRGNDVRGYHPGDPVLRRIAALHMRQGDISDGGVDAVNVASMIEAVMATRLTGVGRRAAGLSLTVALARRGGAEQAPGGAVEPDQPGRRYCVDID